MHKIAFISAAAFRRFFAEEVFHKDLKSFGKIWSKLVATLSFA
jgi:hypothetical protein